MTNIGLRGHPEDFKRNLTRDAPESRTVLK